MNVARNKMQFICVHVHYYRSMQRGNSIAPTDISYKAIEISAYWKGKEVSRPTRKERGAVYFEKILKFKQYFITFLKLSNNKNIIFVDFFIQKDLYTSVNLTT